MRLHGQKYVTYTKLVECTRERVNNSNGKCFCPMGLQIFLIRSTLSWDTC